MITFPVLFKSFCDNIGPHTQENFVNIDINCLVQSRQANHSRVHFAVRNVCMTWMICLDEHIMLVTVR